MFRVVKNHEAAYAVWPARRQLPPGWQEVGVSGAEEECLAAIAERWPAEAGRLLAPLRPDGAQPSAEAGGQCLHELFTARATAHPRATALSDGPRSLTYQELDHAANRLAHRLRRLGAGPEELVGVCAARGGDLVVALLAVLKAGAGYVPLDPNYPAARLAYIVADTACRIVVGPAELRGTVEAAEWVALDDPSLADEETGAPASGVRPDHVAYVIHTSGSTGDPKGVAVSHANVTRLFEVTASDFAFGPADVWTLFHSFAFDFSVWELWGALLHGGRLVVVPYATSRDPESFLELLRAEAVTVLNQTPSAFRQLSRAAEAAGFPELALRLVVFGGEKLEPAGLRPWVERYGAETPGLVNMYGITETTVHVTLRRLTRADITGGGSPIGRPLADLSLRVLDADMAPVPDGHSGELYVGGAGVTRGYLGRPELTAQRFLPDPYGKPGSRLYRTGDLASVSPDGEFVFHGRADSQVQLHGFRIEPGEVEAAVLAHPRVREAAVVVAHRDSGDPLLACYWSPAPGPEATTAELRAALAERLPDHMVPSVFVRLDALPVTAHGKLDTAALPEPGRPGRAAGRAAAPGAEDASPAAALARIWAELLAVDEVGPDDNFFAIGGDSITVLPMVDRARAAGLAITVKDLFRAPTVAGLAALAESRGAAPEPASGPTGQAARPLLPESYLSALPPEVETAYPASALQGGIILHSLMSGDPTLYHDLGSVRVHGPFDPDALCRAWRSVTSRHAVLRTAFDFHGHQVPVQRVLREVEVPVEVVDASAGAGAERETVRRWWREQWRHGFDLTGAPLVRCHVHLFAPDHFQLSVTAHHAIVDGWSFSVLLTELLRGYDLALAGQQPPRPTVLPYRDFIALEQAERESGEARRYWARVLAGARTPVFAAADAPPPAEPPLDPDAAVLIEPELAEGIKALADSLGAPTKSVYLAAHLAATARLTDSPDVTAGLVVSGRPEQEGAENTVGLFLNTVPCRADTAGVTWRELVRTAFAAERELMPHRRLPLVDIRTLAPDGAEPFTALFNYTSMHVLDGLTGLARVQASDWWFSDHNNFPVNVEIDRVPYSQQWRVTVRIDRAVVAGDTADRLAGAIHESLWACVTEPDAGPSKQVAR